VESGGGLKVEELSAVSGEIQKETVGLEVISGAPVLFTAEEIREGPIAAREVRHG